MSARKSQVSQENIRTSKRSRKKVNYSENTNNKLSSDANKDNDDSDFEPSPQVKVTPSRTKKKKVIATQKQENKSENDSDDNVPLKILSKKLSRSSAISSKDSITNHASRPNLSEDESSDSDHEEMTFREVPENFLKQPFSDEMIEVKENRTEESLEGKKQSELKPEENLINEAKEFEEKEFLKDSADDCNTTEEKQQQQEQEQKITVAKTLSKRKSDSKLKAPNVKRLKKNTDTVLKTNENQEKNKSAKSTKSKKVKTQKEPPMGISELLINEKMYVGFSSDDASDSDWEDVNGMFFYSFENKKEIRKLKIPRFFITISFVTDICKRQRILYYLTVKTLCDVNFFGL